MSVQSLIRAKNPHLFGSKISVGAQRAVVSADGDVTPADGSGWTRDALDRLSASPDFVLQEPEDTDPPKTDSTPETPSAENGKQPAAVAKTPDSLLPPKQKK